MNLLHTIKNKFFRPKISIGLIYQPYPLGLPDKLTEQQCIDCGGTAKNGRCLIFTKKIENGIEHESLYDVAEIIGDTK